ncbi:helix-turn-helix domain-containing protein, partial [Bradyrhizobium sp. NBAIM08]|uniref:winged helix-turn-helix transcriptional regulator n=1 Tax=Bradyrhizobium sp. NBAIM08 TaxID=2793815 RepID=UPI001CD55838
MLFHPRLTELRWVQWVLELNVPLLLANTSAKKELVAHMGESIMSKYGQFCPIAKALEVIGDRWTLLIVRNMLCGMTHFNDLERGLPGISRPLLA